MVDGAGEGRYGVHVAAFAPEWLARFTLDQVMAWDGRRMAWRDLTVADCACALAMVGGFSGERVDLATVEGATRAAEVTAVARASTSTGEAIGPMEFGARELRSLLGLGRMADFDRVLVRVGARDSRLPPITGSTMIEVEPREGGVVRYRLDRTCLKAHPLNSACRRSVVLDLARVADMRCVQSVPIFLRALAWTRSRARTGSTMAADQRRITHKGGRFSVSMRVPAGKVRDMFGLAQVRARKPAHLHVAQVVEDLRSAGIESTWSWVRDGRHVVSLDVSFTTTAQAAVSESVSHRSTRVLLQEIKEQVDAENAEFGIRLYGRRTRLKNDPDAFDRSKPRYVKPDRPAPIPVLPPTPAPPSADQSADDEDLLTEDEAREAAYVEDDA